MSVNPPEKHGLFPALGRKLAYSTAACISLLVMQQTACHGDYAARGSSKPRVADCQNRYPSPTGRPALSQGRSSSFPGGWRSLADPSQGLPCAPRRQVRVCGDRSKLIAGDKPCQTRSNSSALPLLRQPSPPAAKPMVSVRQLGPSSVALLPLLRAKALSTARSSVGPSVPQAARLWATAKFASLTASLFQPAPAIRRGGLFASQRTS